ncbi:MAG: VacJ family lipoprotein [Candidatus Synoicihabitans palmerolidicus]|nr:VacJ family lipoprotein [Candidatus Synoicihabitans palmerolidicus]
MRLGGSLLQGKLRRAAQETGKFAVNTVVGVGGIFRPSDRVPALAEVPTEDGGQALAVWRVPAGPYLVLPLLGPSNPRELLGRAGDFVLTPTNWDSLNVGTGSGSLRIMKSRSA